MNPWGGDLAARLHQDAPAFSFFQAVRLLHRMNPTRAPVGRHERAEDEAVRFRSLVSLAFPPSEIAEIQPPAGDRPHECVTVAFMGLAGPLGVLPTRYTALLADPLTRSDTAAARDFLDIFNHRLISLFYRAWERYRPAVAFEARQADAFTRYLSGLIGIDAWRAGFADQHEMPMLFYAGLLSQRPRSASALEGILRDHFDVPVEVRQFEGEWVYPNTETLTSIGQDGQHNQLGVDAVLWERIWDPQARFRIRLGPLSWDQFCQFLPASEAHAELLALTRFVVGEEFSFDVQPVLRAGEVPRFVLGGASARLGWSVWMRTEPLTADAAESVLPGRVAEPH